jgi:tripartite-type tricarboxylate transporter receptor subunit TctC
MRIANILIGSAIALLSQALSALPSAAQSWPSRPVRVILPLGAGADIGARLISEKLAAKWGQAVDRLADILTSLRQNPQNA